MRNETIIALTGGIIGIIGLARAQQAERRLEEVADKLSTNVEELVSNTTVNITADMVDDAIKKHVDKVAAEKLAEAKADAIRSLNLEVRKTTLATLDMHMAEINEKVIREYERKAENLNTTDLERKVTDRVTEVIEKTVEKSAKKAESKADEAVDKMLSEVSRQYRNRMDTITRTYNAVTADGVFPNGITLRLGK